MTNLEGDGQAVEGSDSFTFLGEIFVKPPCAFERLVKEDFREGICLDGTEESQLGPSVRKCIAYIAVQSHGGR